VIASVSGSIERSNLDGAVQLRVGAVVLELSMPAVDGAALHHGEHATLYTSLQLSAPGAGSSSGGIRLYGFATAEGRDLFELLLTGSGVGPRSALALLELSPSGLVRALAEGDEKTLTAAKGVGTKVAKKLIVELGEKAGLQFAGLLRRGPAVPGGAPDPAAAAEADAVEAIASLGFTRLQAEQALSSVRTSYDGSETAQLVRLILAQLR
jgi:Holliday junction DNA helicase RuvA